MAKINPIQNNFSAGEWSPRLDARADLAKYGNACSVLENFVLLPHGGATRRPGTRYVAEVKDSTKKVRLIPFIFSTEQAYIIEAGHEYFRFYMNHGQIQSIPSEIKVLIHADGDNGSTSFLDSASGHTITAGGGVKLSNASSKFGPTSIYFTPASSDYISMGDHADFDLSGAGAVWTFDMWIHPINNSGGKQTIFFQTDGSNYVVLEIGTSSAPFYRAYLKFNIVSGGSPVVTLQAGTPDYVTWGAWQHVRVVENANGYYLFLNGHLVASTTDTDRADNYTGAFYIGANNGTTNFFRGYIDEFALFQASALSTTDFSPPTSQWGLSGVETPYEVATTYTEEELPALKWVQSADTMWIIHKNHKPAKLTRSGHAAWTLTDITFTAMPDWDANKGWPQAGCFDGQRFIYGGTDTYPQTIWGSVSGSYDDFTTGTNDDDAWAFTVPADQVEAFKWLSSSRNLLCGTGGGIVKVIGGEYGITPTVVDSKGERAERARDTSPLKIGTVVLFVEKFGRKLYEMVYSYEIDSYSCPDLTLLAEHITDPRITEISYQQSENTVWGIRADGTLLSMTYLRDQDLVGWGRHTTRGEFESKACIPRPDGSGDEVWVAVRRDIGATSKRFIEYFDPNILLDCAITYSGAEVTTVDGSDHLEGMTVQVVGDNMYYGEQVVTDGVVTLDPGASEIVVGLGYIPTMTPVRPEIQMGNGTSRGKKKAWSDLFVSFLNTRAANINGEEIDFRSAGDALDEAVPLFTGDKQVNQLGWSYEGKTTITSDKPLECTILAIYGSLEVGD